MFATAQELRTMLDGYTLDPDPAGLDAEWKAQADLVLDLVAFDMQAAARSPILQPDVASTAVLAGTWGRDLVLPRRPVVAVTAVSVNDVALTVDAYRWNSRQIIRRGGTVPGLDVQNIGGHWGGPGSTVSVEYLAGYESADVPGWVKSMALRVAARSITNPASMTQQSFGGYAETFARVIDTGGSNLTPMEMKTLRRRFSTTAGTIGGRGR